MQQYKLDPAFSTVPAFTHISRPPLRYKPASSIIWLQAMKRSRSASQYQLRPRTTRRAVIKDSSSSEEDAEYDLANDKSFSPQRSDAEACLSDTSELDEVYDGNPIAELEKVSTRRSSRSSHVPERVSKTTTTDIPEEADDLDGIDMSGSTTFEPAEAAAVQEALLRWYHKNARALPWRLPPRDPDLRTKIEPAPEPDSESAPGAPYAVWVSEVMSQQTRIEVVARYWTRWMTELPTLTTLAQAPADRVRALWAGLGYYRRADALHAAAQQVLRDHSGVLPREPRLLRSLRGVGAYTAGAVASIAYGVREPAVDGNVARVLTRMRPALAALRSGSRASEVAFDTAVRTLLAPPAYPPDLNQALMELGATVCRPRNLALCNKCPVSAMCDTASQAKAAQIPSARLAAQLPIRAARKRVRVRSESVAAAVVCRKSKLGWRFLVHRRDRDGLLAGMWETPCSVVGDGDDAISDNTVYVNIVRRCEEYVGAELSVKWRVATTVTHVFSHIRQTLHIRVATVQNASLSIDGGHDLSDDKDAPYRWVSAEQLTRMALPTQMLKVFKSAGKVINQKFSRNVDQVKSEN